MDVSLLEEMDFDNVNIDWEFIETILKELPSNIYFKDTQCRYLFCTHYWNHIVHDDTEAWSIRGKTDMEIRKDKENARKAYEEDKKLLKTGIGCKYVIETCIDGVTEFLEIIKNPVKNKDGRIIGIVGLINNVTDRIKLQKQLEAYAHTDIMTGLFNRRYLEYWEENEIKPQYFPISIIAADCDGLKHTNDTYGHHVGDEMIRSAAQLLKDVLADQAVMFRMGGDEFLMILNNTDEIQVQNIVDRLREIIKQTYVKGIPLSISFGVCTMKDMITDIENAIYIADKRMYREKEEKSVLKQ